MNRAMMRLSWVFFVLFALSQILPFGEGKAEETAPFTLKAGNGTVDVVCPDGRLLQSLPYGGDQLEEHDSDHTTFVRDMDFDGFPDVGVLFSHGAQNGYYDCWLWREDAGCFVKYEEFRDISDPSFDAERKRVTSFTHGSATDNVTAEYAWEDGRLVLMEETVQEYSPETELFTIRRHERGSNGEMRLVEEKTLTEEELEAFLNGDGKADEQEPEHVDFPDNLLEINSDAEALDGMNIVDALILIKRIAAPEKNPGLDEERLAYRYDGVGEVEGVPALLFSFGSNSGEKFTAERHFAVDETEAVYEMNPVEGSEYRRVEEELPKWLGTFRRGDLTLEIGIYREGPLGFYFGGVFSGEGKEPRQILAAVEGRDAEMEDLEFFLTPDGSAIIVEVEESGDAVTLKRIAGADGSATPGVPLINNLGFDIEAVYAQRGGEKSVKIAGPLANGETTGVDTSVIHERSRRLIVKLADDENEEAPPLQFYSGLNLDEVERMELVLGDIRKVPVLLTTQSVLSDAALAGFSFNALFSHLDSEWGLEAGEYADFMMPLAADGWEEYPNAVASDGLSWSLLSPGPVFREEEDGEKLLSSIAFSAAASQEEFAAFVKKLEWYGITSREHGDSRVFFESPNAFYDVRFDPETDIVELSYLRKSDAEHVDEAEPDDADTLALFEDVLRKISDGVSCTYALHDIDGDGIKELFVHSTDGSGEYTVHSYTTDAETHDLGLFWPRRRLLLGENGDGVFFISGSSGAAHNTIEKARISFDGTRIEILETWEMNEDVYTHSMTETIPESVWDTADERSSGAADAADALDWIPLSASNE